MNEYGLWQIKRKKGGENTEIEDFKKFQLLTSIFSKNQEYAYKELWIALQTEYKRQIGVSISDAKVKKMVGECKNEGWVIQEAHRYPYKLGQYDKDIL